MAIVIGLWTLAAVALVIHDRDIWLSRPKRPKVVAHPAFQPVSFWERRPDCLECVKFLPLIVGGTGAIALVVKTALS